MNMAALYEELFDASPDGLLLIDAETQQVIQFNDAACRQLGYTREEFAGLRISDYQASREPGEIAARVQRTLREGCIEFDTRQRTKTGEIRHMHVWARPCDLAGRRVLHAIFRDVTERRRGDELQHLQSAALHAVADGIVITDRSGVIGG